MTPTLGQPLDAVPAADAVELERAMRTLDAVSADLVRSYRELARRAERMENDLQRTNAALADKVAEADAVTRRLEAVLQSLPTGVVVRDEAGRIARANPAAQAILGAREETLLGRTGHAGLSGADADGSPREVDLPDGRRRVLASRHAWVRDEAGRRTGSVEILDDRTEVAELEERVHDLDKLAALGNMAAGIAHEVRNPLNAVGGTAELLLRELPGDGLARRRAQRIAAGAREANEVLTSMLGLARPEALALEPVDPRELLEAAVAGAWPADPAVDRGAWSVTHTCTAPAFVADRVKLRQALRNLVANALDAQPDGGRVHVRLEHEGDELVACVDDAGPGVDPERRRRIFEPFFTSRAEGTGLGLALVHSLAHLHGGRAELAARPSPLGGARFLIRIPFQAPEGLHPTR